MIPELRGRSRCGRQDAREVSVGSTPCPSLQHRAQRLEINQAADLDEGDRHTPEAPWAQDPQLKSEEETKFLPDFFSALKSSNSRHSVGRELPQCSRDPILASTLL